MGLKDRLIYFWKWLHSAGRREKGCGCVVLKPANFEGVYEKDWPDTELLEEDYQKVKIKEYRNCTTNEIYKVFKLKCTRCGKIYTTRNKIGTGIDYGDKNPDAPVRLQMKHTGWKRWTKKEQPVIESRAKE